MASGRRPEKEFQLFLLTVDGDLEEIGLDETVDIRQPRIEQFFAFRSDRVFYFVIDDRRFPWGACTAGHDHKANLPAELDARTDSGRPLTMVSSS